MNENGSVLVLSRNEDVSKRICETLTLGGVPSMAVSKPGETIKKLVDESFDVLIVDAEITNPNIGAFLGKAREFLPHVVRVVYESSPLDMDLRALINEAGPCAYFTGQVDVELIRELLAHRARLLQAVASLAPSSPQTGVATVPPRVISPTHPQTATPSVAGAASGSASLPGQPLTFQLRPIAPTVGVVKSMNIATENKAKKPKKEPEKEKKEEFTERVHFSAQAEGGPLAETVITAFEHTNEKMEVDLMLDDRKSEIGRVLEMMIEEPGVRLPTLPQIANEVRKLLSIDNVSFERIAEVVSVDPSMSARILEVANSPLYAGKETTRNLQQAVSRIGMRETRNILLAISGENLFNVNDRRLALIMTKLWMHSLACAYSNEILAKDLFIEESSDFFMMGLLHDVGKLIILHLIQQGYERKLWSKNIITDEILDDLLTERHNAFGARLMQKWGYDKSFEEVVYLHNDEYHVHEYEEYVVVTFFSNLLTRKMGFSLREYNDSQDPLGRHEIAQALNMSPTVRTRVEESLQATVKKIRESYF